MKTIILGGFLGAGKTTVVMQLAQYLTTLPSHSTKGNKVIILENEIGEVGIDDMLLRSNGYTVSELFAGCACCTMAGELKGNLEVIKAELDPEWLILEATGVAYPLNIKETMDDVLEIPAMICSLVDCNRFMRMLRAANDLVVSQLENAEVILINKIDLVTAEALEEITAKVREINPGAEIYQVNSLQPLDQEIFVKIAAFASKGE